MLISKFSVLSLCLGFALASVAPTTAQTVADSTPPSGAENACPMPEPSAALKGVSWYSDSKASIIDPVLRQEHDEVQKPLNTFMGAVVAPVDDAVRGIINQDALACADRNLANWARAGAMTQKPSNTAALADQTITVFGLNVMALKRRDAGVPVSRDVQEWLSDITHELVAIYTQGGPRNNMYVWSGAAAAVGSLLQRDNVLERHAGRVWRAAIKDIDKKGHVASEMGRGQRALLYHQYFNSALGALNLAREALGKSPSRDDRSAMIRLGKAVGSWSCDSSPLNQLAGAKQEAFSRWNRAMGYAFNSDYLSADWRECVKEIPEFSDPSYGGRFDLTADVISAGSFRY